MNILDDIVEQKKREVAQLPARLIAAGDLHDAMLERGERRDFLAALRRPQTGNRQSAIGNQIGLIAEVKKASPSAGVICPNFDPVRIAKEYEAAGANCLSVLTDEKYFSGSSEHLKAARAAVSLPVLRKDFILDPWQVHESRAMGADCILLILAVLDYSQARELEDLARSLDMDVLAEVHDEAELDRALGLQTPLLGINNRNLKTMVTSLDTSEHLSRLCPPDRFLISESGIKVNEDILRLKKVCVQGFLVGESLMREPDVDHAVRKLLGGG